MLLRSREALVECLDAQRISERELARRAGLSHATVNHLFTRRRTSCRVESALQIEHVLQCDPGTLFAPTNDFERNRVDRAARTCSRREQEMAVLGG